MEGLHHDTILEPSAKDSAQKKEDPNIEEKKEALSNQESADRFFYFFCKPVSFG